AEHGDAVDRVRLVERVLAIAKAGPIGDDLRAAVLAEIRAALVRPQAPTELRIQLVKLRGGVAGEPQADLERGEQRRAYDHRARPSRRFRAMRIRSATHRERRYAHARLGTASTATPPGRSTRHISRRARS